MDNIRDDTNHAMPPKDRRADAEREQIRLAEYIQARLAHEKETSKRGYQAEVARSTHLSAAHISNVIDRKRDAGPEMFDAMAEYWKITLDGLKARALYFHKNHSLEFESEMDFPNRDEAIAIFGPQFSKETVRRLREVVPRTAEDMSSAWWLKHLELLEEELRAERDVAVRRSQDAADTKRVAEATRKVKPATGAPLPNVTKAAPTGEPTSSATPRQPPRKKKLGA